MAFLSEAPSPPCQAGSKFRQLGGKEQVENKRRRKIIDANASLRNAPAPCLSEPNSCWREGRPSSDHFGLWKERPMFFSPGSPGGSKPRGPRALCAEVCWVREVWGGLFKRLGTSTGSQVALQSKEVGVLSWPWAEHLPGQSHSTLTMALGERHFQNLYFTDEETKTLNYITCSRTQLEGVGAGTWIHS